MVVVYDLLHYKLLPQAENDSNNYVQMEAPPCIQHSSDIHPEGLID